MGVEDPQLKRTLFGYSRDNVRRMLTAREAMFARVTQDAHLAEEKARAAENRARAAEERARAAQEETRATEERLAEREAELVEARRELEDRAGAASSPGDGEPDGRGVVAAGLPVVAGGLTAVLEATEKAVTELIDDARHRGEEQMREAEHRQKDLETKIEQLTEWWNRVEPLVTDVRGSIDEAKDQVTSVPARIGSVLEPVTQAFASLGNRLATLTQMAAIPITGTHESDPQAPPSPPQVVEVGEPDEVVVDEPADAKLAHRGRHWWP
jgi:DNA repair exonuclease SbcCD ATPase subunit